MKEVNIYIKESFHTLSTKDGYYDVLLTTQGKELRFRKSFQDTTYYRVILQGAIDALKKLNQPCIINLYTYSAFGLRKIRYSDGTWKSQMSPSANLDLLLEFKSLIIQGGHKLNNAVHNKELVDIIFCNEDMQKNGDCEASEDHTDLLPETSHPFHQLSENWKSNCIFCNLNSKFDIICQTTMCAAFYYSHPISAGHVIIIPKRHVSSYFDLKKKERESMNTMLLFVKRKIDERFHPDGYNICFNINEAAGQIIPHVHMHVIPRYVGDADKLKEGAYVVIPNERNEIVHQDSVVTKISGSNQKAYSVDQIREKYGNAYLPWDEEADALLIKMFDEEGMSIETLAEIFERAPGGIRSRLKKLGKIE